MSLGFRVVLQQNERVSRIEEKYSLLHGKTSNLFDMEEEVLKVSKKVRLSQKCGGWSSKGSFHQTYKKKNETKQYQSTRKGSNKLWIKGKFHPAPEMFCRLAKLLLTLYLHEAE